MPKDIADIFMIPLKNVTRGIKKFQQVLALRISSQKSDTYAGVKEEAVIEIKEAKEATEEEITTRAHIRRAIWQKTVARTTTYEDFIAPFLTNLSACRTPVLEAMVRRVCERTEEHGIVPENTPPSLTASVIAFCCAALHISIDIADIASVCGISAVTIQKCLKRLQPWKEKLLEE
jgi:transcription initiation factor TFIIIB Brf1 subunit/transcription initiation factor TFIIB